MMILLGTVALTAVSVWLGYSVGFKCGKVSGWNLARQLPCLKKIPQ